MPNEDKNRKVLFKKATDTIFMDLHVDPSPPEIWGIIDLVNENFIPELKEGTEFQINGKKFVFTTIYRANGAASACFHNKKGETNEKD